MKQDEFRERYFIKLISSVLLAVCNALIQMVLPRVFSVTEYGYYTYNMNVFTAVVSLANLSCSNALTAKFSKRNEEIGLLTFYLKFYTVMALVLNAGMMFLYSFEGIRKAFAGQTLLAVMLGLEVCVAVKLLTDSVCVCDAMAVSRFPAAMQIVLKLILSAAVLAGYLAGRLNLIYFYAVQCSLTFAFAIFMLMVLIRDQKRKYPVSIHQGMLHYIREYGQFCRPLILSEVFSQMIVIWMNWTLMNGSGSSGQAMFGAAWQLNTLAGYIFTPYAELLKREFAVVNDQIQALRKRYVQALKHMMWITTYLAVFIGAGAEWILSIAYGDKYAGAAFVTLLMMFYTVYQAWGQVSGSFLLAMEKTRISACLGIFGQVMNVVCVLIFQMPNFIWENGLGPVGIALTYLVTNVCGVLISVVINSHLLKISCWKNLSIQIAPVLLCSVTAMGLKWGLDMMYKGTAFIPCMVKTTVAGVLYTLIVMGVIWIHPQFLDLSREGIKNFLTVHKKTYKF